MNILFLAAEVAPFVSVGGMSQVLYFLPKELRKLGHDIRVFTPKYGTMDETGQWKLQMHYRGLNVPYDLDPADGKAFVCNVKSYGERTTSAYFLENREYYELRANVFGYRDDHLRFALLSKGCLEWLYQIQHNTDVWWPDVIHCHDWHTGYFIDLARRHPRYASMLSRIPIVFTVHNFHFQGNYDFRYARDEEYDDGTSLPASLNSPKLQLQNGMKRGLLYADAINTVSPTHAVEVLTPEYAEGLDDVLQNVRERLTGILNGLDTERFNPAKDKTIKKTFSAKSFVTARESNKKELQKIFGLQSDSNRPLLAFSGRLDKQKGLDMLLQTLPHLLKERPDVQIIFLGSGDDRYRLELTVLQRTFPGQIGLHLRPDFRLPKKIFAGADMILLPSMFEPGGIVALEAMRYGCVPIVRRTGGLNDIVIDFSTGSPQGNGFSFKHIDPWSLFGTIMQALTIYSYPKLWRSLVTNCLEADFSWSHAAVEYNSWYKRISATMKPHGTAQEYHIKIASLQKN